MARQDLLEREREVAALDDALEAARRGDGGLVLIEAAPGLGKSRLLQEVRARGRRTHMEVVGARGSELESGFSFGVALQLFEQRVRAAPEEERATLLQGSAALAGPLLGASAAGDGGNGDPAAGDFPFLHGLHWLVANLAERRPLVLLVDDAHWADEPSLRFLLYLAARLEDLPVAVIVASRPHPSELLARLEEASNRGVLRPQPLSLGAVAQVTEGFAGLLGGRPDEAFSAACHEATGGNPLLLRELLLALAAEGVAPTAAGAARALEIGPEPVARATLLGLGRLPSAATALARAVSVLGDDAELGLAARLADLEPTAAGFALRDLVSIGLLAERPLLAFQHPIVRRSVYEELSPGERALAHQRAAKLLAATRADPERVAGHLVQAPPAGDAEAVAALRAAAKQAATRGAPAAAARYLRRALAEPPSDADRPEVLAALGRAEASAGEPGAAVRLSAALDGELTPRRRAEVCRDLGKLLFARGRFARAAAAFEQGLAALGGDDDGLAVELRACIAAAVLWDPERGLDAVEDPPPALVDHEPTTLAERLVLANLAGQEMLRGEDRERAVELALRAWGDGAMLAQSSADEVGFSALTGCLTTADEFDRSLEISDALVSDAQARGSVMAFAQASYLRAALMLFGGRLTEAIADAEHAMDGRRYGWETYWPAAVWVAAEALLEQGDVPRAQRMATLAAEDEERWRDSPVFAGIARVRGLLAVGRGDLESALDWFARTAHLVEDVLGSANPAFYGTHGERALALAGLGRRDEALTLAEEGLALARRWGAPRTEGMALRALGLVRGGAQGTVDLAEAVAVLEGSSALLERARALIDLGVALRSAGRGADARQPLRSGLDLADRCAAHTLAARARAELLEAGGRPRRRRVSGPEALTPSERRVAEMAARGMTNREIAQALFVTVKAVKWHLGNAYPKLGVRSRAELASALAGGPGEPASP